MAARIINNIISIDPEIVSGTPVFLGTRVPVYILFDYLQSGSSVSDFLTQYPQISQEQIDALLTTVGSLLQTTQFNENIIG